MAEFSKACDVYQGFNSRADVKTAVGFIHSMTIGDEEMETDFNVDDPEGTDEESDLEVVGVISHISWGLGTSDAVYISAQVSTANRNKIEMLTYQALEDVRVEIEWSVYEFDTVAKTYYESFKSCGEESGADASRASCDCRIEKEGGDISMNVAADPSMEVESPDNYAFFIGLKPAEKAQLLTLATSVEMKVAKQWGITTSTVST